MLDGGGENAGGGGASDALFSLMLAAGRGDLEETKRWAGVGGADAQDKEGKTALYWALERGRREVANYLAGETSNLGVPGGAADSFYLAAKIGWADTLALLLPKSHPKSRSDIGWQPIFSAAARNHVDCVALLLPVSDLGALDNDGDDIFDVAISGRAMEALWMIFEAVHGGSGRERRLEVLGELAERAWDAGRNNIGERLGEALLAEREALALETSSCPGSEGKCRPGL